MSFLTGVNKFTNTFNKLSLVWFWERFKSPQSSLEGTLITTPHSWRIYKLLKLFPTFRTNGGHRMFRFSS